MKKPSPLPHICLVLGGVRSGKSRYAETLINERGRGLYLATAEESDDEMSERIRRHKSRRGKNWDLVEEPLDIAEVISRESNPLRPILVDCLTLWISNMMLAGRDSINELPTIIAAAQSAKGQVVFVSNEVGLSIVPDNRAAREFCDIAGLTNQAVARTANTVIFISAGIPNILKGNIN